MPWAPDYATVEELASYTGATGGIDDIELAVAISTASRAVDHATNRQFGVVAAPEARTYLARPDYVTGYWVVDMDDVMAVTGMGVEVDGDAVATYQLEPVNAAAKGRPWTRVAFTGDSEHLPTVHPHAVVVTALWGWSAVPQAIVQATLLQASRLFKRKDAPFGIAGSEGAEMRLLSRLDPDVAVALRPYTRPRMVA